MALLKTLFLPPAGLFVLILCGVLLLRRKPGLGRACIVGGVALLFLLSLPAVGTSLLMLHQDYPPLSPQAVENAAQLPESPRVIVVLSASFTLEAPEFGISQPGVLTFDRLRYAAHLQRMTGLPLLVTGGRLGDLDEPGGVIMKRTLEDVLGAEVSYVEQRATTTWENALYSSALLKREGIDTVYLVTHAWHMPRAKRAFERHGLAVTPAPTGFATTPAFSVFDWLPSTSALRSSSLGFHEALGRIAYRFR